MASESDERVAGDCGGGEPAIVVNGEVRSCPDGLTVESLVADLGLESVICAVEVNRSIVRKPERAGTVLRPGDRVEIVTLVGGG